MNYQTILKGIATLTLIGLALYLVGCIHLFVLVVYVISQGDNIVNFDLESCEPSNPYEIQDLGQFTLPPSADKLKSSCFGLQGWGASASFEIDPAELDQFIASTRIDTPLSATVDLSDLHVRYLDDDMPASYLYGEYISAGYSFEQHILIDTSNPARYSVYVEVYGG